MVLVGRVEWNMIESKGIPSRKELLAIAVEDALNDMGEPTLEIVNSALFQKYHCSLLDCADHPDYLADVLKQTFGYAHIAIVQKIRKNLGEFAAEKPAEEFVNVLLK